MATTQIQAVRRPFQFGVQSLLWLTTAVAVFLGGCVAVGMPPMAMGAFALFVLLRIGVTLFAKRVWLSLPMFLCLIALPIALSFDTLQFQLTCRVSRWSSGDWMGAAMLYLSIPTATLFYDMIASSHRDKKWYAIRLSVELLILSPLWVFISMCIVFTASSIP